MRNTLLIFLACIVLSINGSDYNITIAQVNNTIIKPSSNQKCEESFCFAGDTLLTVQSDSKRINSITLQDSRQKLTLLACPTSNVLTFNQQDDRLRLFNEKDNTCYYYSNNFFSSETKPRSCGFHLNALLADQKTYQYFFVQVYLTDKSDSSSSTNASYLQISMLILTLLSLI